MALEEDRHYRFSLLLSELIKSELLSTFPMLKRLLLLDTQTTHVVYAVAKIILARDVPLKTPVA